MLPQSENSRPPVAHISSGLFQTGGEWIHPRRIIDSYEIIFVREGEVAIREADADYVLRPGDALLLTPGRLHEGTRIRRGRTAFYWAHFTTPAFDRLGLGQSYFPQAGKSGLTELFSQLLHFAHTPEYPPGTADLMMGLILCELAAFRQVSRPSRGRLLRELTEWVRVHRETPLTVEGVAAHFGYHPTYLSGVFKKACGMGLKDYLVRERLAACKDMLLTTRYSVKQIADRLGWKSENQMLHFFQFHEKISPTRFRNLYWNTHLNAR